MFRNRDAIERGPAHEAALDCLAAGIRAAHPERAVSEHVSVRDGVLTVAGDAYELTEYDDVLVVGGGNAAGVVAEALEDRLADHLSDGLIVTDEPTMTSRIQQVRGRHPIPNADAEGGVRTMRELVGQADRDTLILAVITGGGSALLPAPAGEVSLTALQTVTDALLDAGASIEDLNAVRKHLSAIKGGRLGRESAPATVIGLVFSDVVGDDLGVIASGPLTADPTTYADALEVLDRYDVAAPPAVRTHLERGVAAEREETPAPADDALGSVTQYVLASNHTAIDAARAAARDRGLDTMVLAGGIEGEARDVGRMHAAIAIEALERGDPVTPPAVVISGGETTVTVRGDGDGGPNQEVAVGAALGLARGTSDPAVLASIDTDGIDGASDAAGGIVDQATVRDPRQAQAALDRNDTGPYLEARDGRLVTGFTGTNVNDLRVVVIGALSQ
ncbi:MAG: glycerate kinase [Halobacteriaceae archaeon]